MQHIVYLLLVSFGALSILGIFHFTIFLQQKDKAFRNYSFYLLLMSVFNLVRLSDERLGSYYSLSVYTVGTWDPVLANFAFLMYVNFLGVILNINAADKFFYKGWRFIKIFVPTFLLFYLVLRIVGNPLQIADTVISVASFGCMGFGIVMGFRLLALRKEKFYQLIIVGTLISVLGVLTGLIFNTFIYKSSTAFGGLYFLEISMLIESVFLSAALGYRLKVAYQEKEKFQLALLEETQKRELLAVQTSRLLQKELEIKEVQNRISKDLHDDIGASLSSMHIYGELATKVWETQPQESKMMIDRISTTSKDLMNRMGDIIWSMKPADEEKYSFKARLTNYATELLAPKNILAEFEIDETLAAGISSPEVRKNLLLMAKEAINNIAKYSEAAKATILFKQQNGEVILLICDDGKGYDANTIQEGNGLQNIQQRCKQLNGIITINTASGQGVSINCSFRIATIRHT